MPACNEVRAIQRATRNTLVLFLSTLMLLAAGCGGGDSGSTNPPTSPPPTPTAPANLSYPAPQSYVFTVGTAITPLQPTVSGNVTTYSITPALPQGLSMSASGVISGTPTTTAPQAVYVASAANSAGAATTSLSMTVNAPVTPPSSLNYAGPRTYTVGTAMAPLQPSVTGTVNAYSVLPALPAGLTLDTGSGIITGTPTAATASATYRITAGNAGGSTFYDLVITVIAAPPVTYRIGGSVSGFAGGSLVLQLNGAEERILSANGGFQFTTALNTGAAYLVTVKTNPSAPEQTCQVRDGSGTVASANVTNVVVTCEVVRYDFSIQVSGLNGTGLVMKDVQWNLTTSIVRNGLTLFYRAAADSIYDLVASVEPTGPAQFCKVRNGLGFVIDQPVTVAVECRDKPAPARFVYVPNYNSANISAFSVNQQTGALTPVPGSPFATATFPAEAFSTPDGKFLYVRSDTTESIAAFAINATTGALSPIPGSPFASANPFNTKSWQFTTTMHPSGRFMYRYGRVGNFIGVLGYTIDPQTGALALIPGSPFPAGFPAVFGNVAASVMRMHPDGQYLYFSHEDGATTDEFHIAAFSINATTGALQRASGTALAVPSIPDDMVFDPLGRFMYALFHDTRQVAAARINVADASLQAITGGLGSATGGNPWRGIVDPSGRFLVTAVDGPVRAVTELFTIDQTTGALMAGTFLDTVQAPSFAVGTPVLHGNGRLLYQSIATSNDISVTVLREFMDQGTLHVPAVNPVDTLAEPTELAMDPAGKWLYVAGGSSNTLAAYSIDVSSGALQPVPGGPVAVGTNPFAIVLVP